MNDYAAQIQKRANALNISIAELCRRAGCSRAYFELLKKRVPKSVQVVIRIDEILTKLEEETL